MRNFGYQKAGDMDTALAVLAERPGARPLAGGAELVNLLKARIEAPDLLLDINALDLDEIRSGSTGLRIGALARMADVAGDPAVALGYPVIAQALEASASPQVRNAGTVAGTLMQRTRCPYFR
ncbi:MAG: FAD binding domain-containing protein, partial [Actinomadura rubrobrunea]|nr:FAD binding domain-containing protein [Actinomadura rubrobrunea]